MLVTQEEERGYFTYEAAQVFTLTALESREHILILFGNGIEALKPVLTDTKKNKLMEVMD